MFHLRLPRSLFRFAAQAPQFDPFLRLPKRWTAQENAEGTFANPYMGIWVAYEGAFAPSLRSPPTALRLCLRAAERG